MKSKVTAKKDNFTTAQQQEHKSKEPPVELMQRLAMGQKAVVEKHEMKKITSKNYENLPEIKQKKEMEKKKEEQKLRQ